MELGQHAILGDLSGNPTQAPGRHRDLEMPKGIGLIPHGNRERCKPEYNQLEERDSDPNIRRI